MLPKSVVPLGHLSVTLLCEPHKAKNKTTLSTRLPYGVQYSKTRMAKNTPEGDMLQGTLDMLILQTLVLGPAHGHSIAHAIERRSDEILQVEHGSLYPALYRLEDRGWIAAFWGTSENNRKAKYYRLTPTGRKQLATETNRWNRLVSGISRVLRPATE
jgi:PadR family transcriptional regulator PadR